MSWFEKKDDKRERPYSQVKEGYNKRKKKKIKKERAEKEERNSSGNKNIFGI